MCSQRLTKATNWVWMWVLKLVMDWGEKSLTAAGRQAVAHKHTHTVQHILFYKRHVKLCGGNKGRAG